ncbi:hypothetical protein IGL98_002306 [Enterococcus sp. DIV0840]|uniref:DUF1398 family protein n=1 Tax=Enterococcus TaxID=1350 RepID=UPI001A8F5BF2|nr:MULTISPECIES: DUF1398 family protein [Enterococcus]MBO0433272.1 DUF1398 family protein [Enterococcus sp. DIV0849a]MBO0473432.1 DUF1398 family protein [Enterococcus ureasiticus]
MSLNLKAIEEIVNNEKNAGGFSELIRDFKKIGVKKYDYLVGAGMYRYYDETSYIEIRLNGTPKNVGMKESSTAIKKAVLKAQAGDITFEEFTELAGAAGVAYWRTDLAAMQVDYFGQSGEILLSEPIPEV